MIPYSYLALVSVSSAGAVADEWCFTDDIRYALAEYAPGVAARRASRVGGNGAYAEVADNLTVHVLGGTAAQCVANYDSLIGALDQAGRWAQEDGAPVVQLRMRVLGGAVGELAAVVLGAEPGEAPASPDPAFDETDGCWTIRNVALKFSRRGLLLAPTAESVNGSTVAIGEISTATLASHPTLSPCRAIMDAVDASDSGYGFWLAGASASQFQIINAKDMTSSGTVGAASSTADAAGNYSRSGNVLRFSAASGATSMRAVVACVIPASYPVVHVFCNARPASATPAWDLQILHYDNYGFRNVYQSGARVPVPQVAGVSMIYLGAVPRVEAWGTIELIARVTTAAYPQTLDVDTLVLLGDDETTTIIGVFDGEAIRANSAAGLSWNIGADPRALSHPSPLVSARATDDTLRYPYQSRGDAYSQQRGASMAGLLYINAATSTSRWRASNLAGSGAATMRLAVKRNKGYRVPQ